MSTNAEILATACPICGAGPGEPCDRPLLCPSEQGLHSHQERRKAAYAAAKKGKELMRKLNPLTTLLVVALASLAFAGAGAASTSSIHFTKRAAPGIQRLLRATSPLSFCKKVSSVKVVCLIEVSGLKAHGAFTLISLHKVRVVLSVGSSVKRSTIPTLAGWAAP